MTCTCGTQLASNASLCPRCGKRITRKSVKLLAWLFGIGIVFVLIMAAAGPRNSTASLSIADQQKKAKSEAQFQLSVTGARNVMSAMRNPDSFKLSSALLMDDGTVCYQYRAQNGFGGMNIGNAVLTSKGVIRTNEMEGFRKLWNFECATKSGVDKTWEVNYAIGKESLYH